MHNLDLIEDKIKSIEEIFGAAAGWRSNNKKIVFTNGCFDIVHAGHIDYLSRAADLGDILVVGVNSDASVRELKGEDRPVQDQHGRLILLASLLFVNAVVLFHDATPYRLIEGIKPDFLVKGSDYDKDNIIGADVVRSHGGKVVTIDFLKGYSTSSVLDKIRRSG